MPRGAAEPRRGHVRERVGRELCRTVGRVVGEALAHPVLEAAEHLLDGVAEQGELEGGARGAVASGSPAVHDHRVPAGIRGRLGGDAPPGRWMAPGTCPCAHDASFRVSTSTKPGSRLGERGGHIGDVRLEAEAAAEVGDRRGAVGDVLEERGSCRWSDRGRWVMTPP